jgi:hypothetical protein
MVVVHLVGCTHGPLPSGAGRIDAPAVLAGGASLPAPGAAQVAAEDGACERHHGGTQVCVGVDEPVVAQAEPGRMPLPPSDAPGSRADERLALVRGPPPAVTVVPGSGRARAVLQVWRN